MAYEKDGIQYPSVTTITGMLDKPALLSWSARMAVDYVRDHWSEANDPTDNHAMDDVLEQAKKAYTQKRDSAADSGKICHAAISQHISGSSHLGLFDEGAKRGFNAFLDWEASNDVKWLESELKVFSVMHGYAGRFDAIGIINGVKYLIDFKTSSGVYDEMRYQLCAYRQAYNEELQDGEESIERLAVLHLNKLDESHTWHDFSKDMGRYTELFNVLTRAYYLMKNRRLKNNPIVAEIKGDSAKAPF